MSVILEYGLVLGIYSLVLWLYFAARNVKTVQSYEVIDGKLSNVREMGVKPEQLRALLKKTEADEISPIKLYLLEAKNGNFLFNHNLIVRFPLTEVQKQQRDFAKMKRKDGV